MLHRDSAGNGHPPVIRVMIVDDNESVRATLQFVLEDLGLQVVGTAQDGQEAVQLCPELHPHVVLMDLAMPGMDGIAASRLIKQQCPDVQIVMLTNFPDKERMREALQAGAHSWLSKQVSVEELLQAIRAACP